MRARRIQQEEGVQSDDHCNLPKPAIQGALSPPRWPPGEFYAFILIRLPGLEACLETQNWFTVHTHEPISALRVDPHS